MTTGTDTVGSPSTSTTVQGEVGEHVIQAPIPPAPGADDQKPITDADKTADSLAAQTPEQIEEARKQKARDHERRRLERQKTGRIQAETEVKLLRERLEKLEAKPAEAVDPKEPKREQFEDYEAYLRAVAKFDAAQETSRTLKAEREERQKAEQQRTQSAGQEKTAKEWSEREKAFQATTKDYAETVTEYVDGGLKDLSDVARRAIVESEVGPQVLHHLATNDEDAERIAELSPLEQVKELGRLEAKMVKPQAKTGKLASDAPGPITPTKSAASASHGLSENASQDQYEATRKSQGARWARN